jgi:hypothetical protein
VKSKKLGMREPELEMAKWAGVGKLGVGLIRFLNLLSAA